MTKSAAGRWCFVLPVSLHLGVATVAWGMFGVDMRTGLAMPWDAWWQTLPLVSLRTELLSEVAVLHAQPPLHNLLVGMLAQWSTEPLWWLQLAYTGLGAASCGLAGSILWTATGSRILALTLACAFALHPALLLYEAFPLYTIPATFLVMAGLFCVTRFQARPTDGWLLALVAVTTLLVLLRSLYHPLFLLLCIAFVGLLAERRARVVLLSILIALPALGWSARNLSTYGSAGSTWAGCNLFKVARAGHTEASLAPLLEQGSLAPATLRVPVFSPPAAYRAHGFTERSKHPALARNDLHNANIPAICALYGESALRLIAHDPLHYLGNVGDAYRQFSRPSSGHAHVEKNRERILGWERLVSQGLFLGAIFGERGSVFFLLVPLSIGVCAARLWRVRRRGVVATLRGETLLLVAGFTIAWTALVGCMADLGENERFRLPVEMPVLMVLAIGAHAAWQRRHGGTSDAGPPRDPSELDAEA